ncbi:ABC transporter ATP-binding protein [Parablautia muri]|uniref:ABC transporter ATP-binding protein n=1 Tax=Parablautia muri TaxID=2320879 RepID=A0A9X5BC86_9FIRM|nr:ABC transporter ATP-binding protein [Parablautia muri]NBJ91339.1 ABC transporter ATP-binding protein [Parablautia muri]
MNDIMIDVKEVTKIYKIYNRTRDRILDAAFPFLHIKHTDFYALSHVSFQVHKGEIVGIIGKNGSGKSTILKIITGVLIPSGGSVIVNGRISSILELGTGFNMDYTGIENIYLNGIILGISREEMKKRIPQILEFADIGDFVYQPVKNYSSGMFVRLAFAVAINVDPDILIVDEALAVGDTAFQAKCMAKMEQLMKSGTTILFVTHDMNTVRTLCKRCVYLENGRILSEGPAAELADLYLHKTRVSMNQEHLEIMERQKEIQKERKGKNIDYNNEFARKVDIFREGTGEVRFIACKVFNENGKEEYYIKYNEKVTIEMQIEFFEDIEVGLGYHIRDNKNMELLGSTLALEKIGKGVIKGKRGERFRIKFRTLLPILEGVYNIMLVMSVPVIANKTVLFVDLVNNAAIFEVGENIETKLWNKVHLDNEVTVERIN